MSVSKTDEVRRGLEILAREVGPGGALPPARTLRERLGASNASLNAALDELAARGQVVRKPGSGVYVSESFGRRRIALIVAPRFFVEQGASPFWGLLLGEARARATARGEVLVFHFAEGETEDALLPRGLAEDVACGRLSGALAIGLNHSQTRWIEARNVPVVAFAGPARCLVQLDNEALIPLGVAALARAGRTRLALLSPTASSPSASAFRNACAAQQVAGRVFSGRDGQPVAARGWAMANAVAASECDGVLSTDDVLTQGFLMGLRRAGRENSFLVATHANRDSPVLLGWEDALIRLQFDPAAIAQGLFACLDDLLSGATPSGTTIIADAGFPPLYPEPIRALSLAPTLLLPA